MALVTAGDVISLALRASGVLGVGQTALAQDTSDALDLLNTLLITWQLNRWLISDLTETSLISTGTASYTIGPSPAAIVTPPPRPDKIDAVFVRLISTGEDTYLYPYMSREGYDRAPFKGKTGVPLAWFYDATIGPTDPTATTAGTLYFAPIPSNLYQIHVNLKTSIGQLAATTSPINLPQPYIVALLWNLAADLRPVFQMPEDPQVTRNAQRSLQAMLNSIVQVPAIVTPAAGNRGGIYSVTPPPGVGAAPPSNG